MFLLRRRLLLPFSGYPSIVYQSCNLCSEAFRFIGRENEANSPINSDNSSTNTKSPNGMKWPLPIPSGKDHLESFKIELVDPNLWQLSFGLAHTSSGANETPEVLVSSVENEVLDGISNSKSAVKEFSDFDEIDNLRLHKKLFYKLDRDSKEFEEYNVNFYQKKSFKKSRKKTGKADVKKECNRSEKLNPKPLFGCDRIVKQKGNSSRPRERARPCTERGGIGVKELELEVKKVRTPTFNQITDPYHLPFCLDIYITKGSVRACIVHRITSKVVTVAHSISKDMKFDLTSRKDTRACAAVGGVLAQRAIEDDIHNVVYTPRKGDKIEGKLQIVLQSIIDHGLEVKVKLKQKKPVKHYSNT